MNETIYEKALSTFEQNTNQLFNDLYGLCEGKPMSYLAEYFLSSYIRSVTEDVFDMDYETVREAFEAADLTPFDVFRTAILNTLLYGISESHVIEQEG